MSITYVPSFITYVPSFITYVPSFTNQLGDMELEPYTIPALISNTRTCLPVLEAKNK